MVGLNNRNMKAVIYKETFDGEIKFLGIMDSLPSAKKYVESLNKSDFAIDGSFFMAIVDSYVDIIPYEDLVNLDAKSKVAYAEVVGFANFSEVSVLGIKWYDKEPMDYVDESAKYHVFFRLDDYDENNIDALGLTSLYSSLLRSFGEMVYSYEEGREKGVKKAKDNGAKIGEESKVGKECNCPICEAKKGNITDTTIDTDSVITNLELALKEAGVRYQKIKL